MEKVGAGFTPARLVVDLAFTGGDKPRPYFLVERAKDKGSCHIGMSPLLFNETLTVTTRLFPP